MIHFRSYISCIFHNDLRIEFNNHLLSIDKDLFDAQQLGIVEYGKNYLTKHNKLPSSAIFERDYKNVYIPTYINEPIEDLRGKFKEELTMNLFNKLTRKVEQKDAVTYEDIKNLVKGYEAVNRRTGGLVSANERRDFMDEFGFGGLDLNIPFIDEEMKMDIGTMYLLFGQTGGTKSYLLSYISAMAALQGHKVLIIPAEMGKHKYMVRMTSILNGVSWRDYKKKMDSEFREGKFDTKFHFNNMVNNTTDYLFSKGGGIYFTESNFPTVDEAKTAALKINADLVIIDSLYELANKIQTGSSDEYYAQSVVYNDFKLFANEGINGYKPRIFAASQVGRAGQTKQELTLQDIAGSIKGAYDAHAVLLLSADKGVKNVYNLRSGKVRDSDIFGGSYGINWNDTAFDFYDGAGIKIVDDAVANLTDINYKEDLKKFVLNKRKKDD